MKDIIQRIAFELLGLLTQSAAIGDHKLIPFPLALFVVVIGIAVIGLILWLLAVITINAL